MANANRISFLVQGRYALFSDPVTRAGGEKFSYTVPTAQALKGITESIYWKPTFLWHIERVRVLNRIQTQSKGIRPIKYGGGNDLSIQTYLKDVAYQVEASFYWNEHRPELAHDRNEDKHYQIALRMLERGGRRSPFLGVSECPAYIEPCVFGEGAGAYDDVPALALGLMFHSFSYPDENGQGVLQARFWRPVMRAGVIEFPPLGEEIPVVRTLRGMAQKPFVQGQNFSDAQTLALEEGLL